MSRLLLCAVIGVVSVGMVRGADICVESSTGFASMSQAPHCPAGSTPFRAASANQFNILWSAWTPTKYPHPPHIGNLSTSFKALDDMAAGKEYQRILLYLPWFLLGKFARSRYRTLRWASLRSASVPSGCGIPKLSGN
jgi:hypothetical protein